MDRKLNGRRTGSDRPLMAKPARASLAILPFSLFLALLGGCEPQLDSEDGFERGQAISKLTDPSQLVKIAVEGGEWMDRSIAIAILVDGKLLATVTSESDILELDKHTEIVLKAVSATSSIPLEHRRRHTTDVVDILYGLSDPQILSITGDISITTKWARISQWYSKEDIGALAEDVNIQGERLVVLVKTGKTGFTYTKSWESNFPKRIQNFNPADDNFRETVRDISELLTDVYSDLPQTTLAHLAFDGRASIRIAAVQNVTDQSLLSKITRENKEFDVRIIATKKLTDQSVLEKIAREDRASYIRRAATEKLTDQSALEKIALEDEDSDVRAVATAKLTDQSALEKIALEDEEYNVREMAVEKLTDQSALEKIALEDRHWSVRRAATKKLTDQSLLAKIAQEEDETYVLYWAVDGLTDQPLLAKIALEARNGYARRIATKKLTDQSLLAQIAHEDLDGSVRKSAQERLEELEKQNPED